MRVDWEFTFAFEAVSALLFRRTRMSKGTGYS